MKIKSYQQGGITYLPTTNRTEAASTSGAASSSSSSDSSKVPGFTKELIDIIKENGLDSDVSVFLNKVDNLLRRDPTGENINARTLTSLIRQANLVRGQQQDYEKAMASLENENAWGEYATDKNGYLYVADDEGNVSKVSANNIKNSNLTPLTNEELLNLRRRDPRLAYESGILDDIAGTVGMESIVDYVNKAIDKLGTTSLSGFSAKQANNIITGIENLVYNSDTDISKLITVGPDGVYKISKETTAADTHVYEALNYLYSILPNTYKNTLRAKAEVEGYDTQSFLLSSLVLNTDRKIQADYDATASKAMGFDVDPLKTKSDAAKGGSEQLTQDNYLGRISAGEFGPARMVSIIAHGNNPEDNARMNTLGYDLGPIIGYDKQTLHADNLQGIIENAWGIQAGNTDSITFGNMVVDVADAPAIIWDGMSHLQVVQLPYTYDNSGKIIVDYSKLEKLDTLNQKIRHTPGITQLEVKEEIKKIFNDPENVMWDSNQKCYIYSGRNTMPFLTFKAYTNSDSIKIDKNAARFLEKIDKQTGKKIEDLYNNLMLYGKNSITKNDKPSNTRFKKGSANDFYAGNVYIPIENSWSGFNVSGIDQWYPKTDYMNVESQMRLKDEVVQRSYDNKTIKTNW